MINSNNIVMSIYNNKFNNLIRTTISEESTVIQHKLYQVHKYTNIRMYINMHTNRKIVIYSEQIKLTSLIESIIIGAMIGTRILDSTLKALARISWLGSYTSYTPCNHVYTCTVGSHLSERIGTEGCSDNRNVRIIEVLTNSIDNTCLQI